MKVAGKYTDMESMAAKSGQEELARQEQTSVKSGETEPAGAVLRTGFLMAMRVAVCMLILAVGGALLKYNMTSSARIYEKYFSAYDLNTSRDAGKEDVLDEAYYHKNWVAVSRLFNDQQEKSNKAYFLSGLADLELKKYGQAIDKFQQIIATNAGSGRRYFQDEAQFYLAMGRLANDDARGAMPLLENIRADKNHLYHDRVSQISLLDLRIACYRCGRP